MRCPTDAARTLQRSPSPRSGGNTHGAGSRPTGRGRGFSPRPGRSQVEGPNPSAESSHLRTQCRPAGSFSIRSPRRRRAVAVLPRMRSKSPRVAQLVDEPRKLAVPAALMMPIACSAPLTAASAAMGFAQPFGPPLQRSSAEFPPAESSAALAIVTGSAIVSLRLCWWMRDRWSKHSDLCRTT
jgi:hypothetical protein